MTKKHQACQLLSLYFAHTAQNSLLHPPRRPLESRWMLHLDNLQRRQQKQAVPNTSCSQQHILQCVLIYNSTIHGVTAPSALAQQSRESKKVFDLLGANVQPAHWHPTGQGPLCRMHCAAKALPDCFCVPVSPGMQTVALPCCSSAKNSCC